MVLAAAAALGAYSLYVFALDFQANRSLEASSRNVQKLHDLSVIRQKLLDYRKAKPHYPDRGTSEHTELFKDLLPPTQSVANYVYVSNQVHFAVCAPLEGGHGQKAIFTTDTRMFTALSHVCTESLPAERADIMARGGLNAEHATNFLDPSLGFALTDKETVRDKCASSSDAKTVLYGCYVSPPPMIYVIDIREPTVASETYVVAIHEYLHAVYSRMTEERKAEIRPLLDAELVRPEQAFLRDELDPYTAEQKYDELFARLATESESLAGPMEKAYSEYFVNRRRLVALHAPFRGINERLQSLNARLSAMKAQTDRLRATGQIDAYNALVDPYNELVAEYNALSDKHNLLTK